MTPYEFKATLRPATQAQLDRLDRAHWRYISLIGLVSDVVAAGVVAADQKPIRSSSRDLREGLFSTMMIA